MDFYDKQRDCVFDFWASCCSSNTPDLTKYVTFEELDEIISGISGASYDDTELRGLIDTKLDISAYTPVDLSEITAQLEALQGSLIHLADRVSTLERLMAQKADNSALTAIWDAIEECCSGDTPTPTPPEPTPDTGDTPTGKAIVYLTDGTSYNVPYTGSGTEFINVADTFPDGTGQTLVARVNLGSNVFGIGVECFKGCTNMSGITLNEGLESIGVESLANCSSLASISIPSSVEHITDTCFYGCDFDYIIFNSTTPPRFNYGDYTSLDGITDLILVPEEALSTYRTAWSGIANKIQAIQ